MTENVWHASADAATIYQDVMVPALMAEWAPRVAAAANIRPGQSVLDVACGTGILARAVSALVGPTGNVTGLDLSPRMLAVASRLSPAITWREGAAESLPFADESFDAVVSQFGLMFFPERARALREMIRVLKPGGRLAVAVWASLDHTPAYAAEVALVERLAGASSAAPLRAPFVLGDQARLADYFHEAGIPDARIDLQQGRGVFPSVRMMVELDVRVLLPMMDVTLEESRIAEILGLAEAELLPFVTDEDGQVAFDSPAIIATASKPSP